MKPQAAWNGAEDLPGSQNFNRANAPTQQTLHDFFGPPTFKTVNAAWFCNRLLVGAYLGEDQACEKGWIKGQLGVPLTVYPWYLLCSLGILGDNLPINTHYIGLT